MSYGLWVDSDIRYDTFHERFSAVKLRRASSGDRDKHVKPTGSLTKTVLAPLTKTQEGAQHQLPLQDKTKPLVVLSDNEIVLLD